MADISKLGIMLRQTQIIVIFFLIYNCVFSQYHWSYDTIPDRKIVEASIYRTEYINGQPDKDSVLKVIRFYNDGLRVQELYFKDRNCNDSIWYFYNANRLLIKVIETDNDDKRSKNTLQFFYDSLSNNIKQISLNDKNEITKKTTYTRIYNNERQLQLLFDSTTYKDIGLIAGRTKYFYNDKNILLKTLYYYKDTINGREGTIQSDNPNIKRKPDSNFLSVSNITKKNELYIQIVHYATNSKDKVKYIDRYYYK